ncbi:MAG TPA: hypothetical protein VI094_15620 [Propionibacteriaceae bacterium]
MIVENPVSGMVRLRWWAGHDSTDGYVLSRAAILLARWKQDHPYVTVSTARSFGKPVWVLDL